MTKLGWKPALLLAPGTAVALFALAAIALPVGSNGLGQYASAQAGAAPALARWARDIHDGFWHNADAVAIDRHDLRERAQVLCALGEAEEAVAIYRDLSRLTWQDRDALWTLADRLVIDGQYLRAEWYVRQADALLDGNMLRNNLAWHYTQTDQRAEAALDLALESVSAGRNACNVDTLAWAYWRNGELAEARATAHETLRFSGVGLGMVDFETEQAKESSRALLHILDAETGR